MVTMGHSRDITPLLTSLALSKHLDICATESVVVVGVIVADPTDASSFASAVRYLAVNFVMTP